MGFTFYDDDDSQYFRYENMSDWHNGDGNSFYNGGTHNSISGVTSRVRFKMDGTIFRLYCQTYVDGRNINIKVIDNGVHIDTINVPQRQQNGHVLFYTSPTLSEGIHDIILEHDSTSTGYMMFDGIDTDGFFYTQVGGVFPSVASPGWKRVDNTDTGFLLNGTWSKTTESPQWGGYKNTWTWSTNAGDSIWFALKSSKLRIYTYGWSDTSGYDLYIDGVFVNRINTNFGITNSLLSYENLNLSNDTHIIQMIIKDKSLFPGSTTTRILLDCIDIDQQGELIYKLLPSPEANWTRYDGSDVNVILNNMKTLTTGDTVNYLNGNAQVTDDTSIPSSIKIKTSGSKIRLIAPVSETTNKNVIVKVDGNIIDTFSTLDINVQGKILYYETPELIHTYDKYITVEFIYPDENSNAFFDCFDIYNGDLLQNPMDVEDTNSNVIYEFNNLTSNGIKIDAAGIYSIECWGANGGGNKNRSEGSSGGWGGYSYGEIYLDIDDIIYCTPGGQGVLATTNFNGGGFNGGGNGGANGHGGGGGTDVRYKTNDITHRIIVAGGGGGADNVGSASTGGDDGSGGHGGGIVAQGAWIGGTYYSNYGASQDHGYSLGVGQSATVATDTGGAGGGYYGGFVTNNNNGGAGGGSSYIGSLNNAYTIGGVWWGNGKVKITLLQADKIYNFQHYVIEHRDKYVIPNVSNFDITKKEFREMSSKEIVNCNKDLSMYITNVDELFKPFIIDGIEYFPFDYINWKVNLRIKKILGHRDYEQTDDITIKRKNLTIKTDFTKINNTTVVKMKNHIILEDDILNKFIITNDNSTCKIALECNSMLFGNNFINIKEDDIMTKGFNPYELKKLDIPYNNIRIMFCFTRNIGPEDNELQNFKIIKDNDNLRKLLNYDEYTVISKQDNDNIYIIVNNATKTLIVNKLEKENIEYRVKDTLNTF